MDESNRGRRPLPAIPVRALAASLAARAAVASGSAIRPVAIGVPGQR